MRKISAVTSYHSGVLVDPRSVRGASNKLPEPLSGWQFKTLNEAKAYIARRRPAREGRFRGGGRFFLTANRDAAGEQEPEESSSSSNSI